MKLSVCDDIAFSSIIISQVYVESLKFFIPVASYAHNSKRNTCYIGRVGYHISEQTHLVERGYQLHFSCRSASDAEVCAYEWIDYRYVESVKIQCKSVSMLQ